ncbi:L-fucose isomerase [Terrilactibacillus sp. BCM23-1]|uniref:L-fucose isomerase n=1 Tax=Terrilactibacillus tamarindi TaxID=2599694 RepID=A0A6N8CRS5_9BACI|nr:L-fucose isomerase [Terrilactibacillus tamarindi]MTT32338.1 L-fucose isomerase [Terrilactibacillus tamarindi]
MGNTLNRMMPRIGIRPIIDGRRRGIRESLEEKTMTMAQSVKELLSNNLRYPNGEAVECIISDSTIGGVREASECAEKFKKENVGLTISVTPCWCYGAETIDMDPSIPKAIWGFNGTERPGAVYLAAALAAHNQKGLPAFGIYGQDVQDISDDRIPQDVQEKLLQFAKAGLAVALMKGTSYLAMGSVSMGIAGSAVEPSFFQKYLGMRNEYVDMSEFIRRIEEEIYDQEEYKKALKWTKEHCKEGDDKNKLQNQRTREQKNDDWEMVVKMTLIARDLMVGNPRLANLGFEEEAEGHFALAGGFQGQRQWTDHFPNGDFTEAILNSSFDWNGIRAPYIFATENDSLNAVSMLFNYLLTNTPQLFADVRTFWSPESVKRVTGKTLQGKAKEGIIHLINSGSAALDACGKLEKEGKPQLKPFWEIQKEEVDKCLKATTWYPGNTEYFRGGGFSSKFVTDAEMPVTMSRINLIDGLGPVLQLVEGYTIQLSQDIHQILDERTDVTWPTTWFAPKLTGEGAFKDVYSVMNHWGANHGAISYGHIGKDLITLASLLRIPVTMHNVDEKLIFRPSVWNSFGTSDLESADFRACANFGPLYGK